MSFHPIGKQHPKAVEEKKTIERIAGLYIKGWLYSMLPWQVSFFTMSGNPPAANVHVPGAPGTVCKVCTRATVGRAGSAWRENNARTMATTDAYFFTAPTMTANEMRATAALFQPFAQICPTWQDSTGRDCWFEVLLLIFTSFSVK